MQQDQQERLFRIENNLTALGGYWFVQFLTHEQKERVKKCFLYEHDLFLLNNYSREKDRKYEDTFVKILFVWFMSIFLDPKIAVITGILLWVCSPLKNYLKKRKIQKKAEEVLQKKGRKNKIEKLKENFNEEEKIVFINPFF